MDVKGKNVFITGSTRGIGKAMALAFAKAGANIILNGRGEIPKEKIEEIEAFGVKCVGVSGDISDYEKAGQMIKEAEGQAEAILKVQQANADGLRFLKEVGVDEAVIQLKSLEAFMKAADGKATKIIIPSEIQKLAGLVTSAVEVANQ